MYFKISVISFDVTLNFILHIILIVDDTLRTIVFYNESLKYSNGPLLDHDFHYSGRIFMKNIPTVRRYFTFTLKDTT